MTHISVLLRKTFKGTWLGEALEAEFRTERPVERSGEAGRMVSGARTPENRVQRALGGKKEASRRKVGGEIVPPRPLTRDGGAK